MRAHTMRATWSFRQAASGWRSARTSTSTSYRCRRAARLTCRSRRRPYRPRRATLARRRLPELDRWRHARVDARPDALSRGDVRAVCAGGGERRCCQSTRPLRRGAADRARGRQADRYVSRYRRAHRHDERASQVIDNGTILIRDNRIAAVGAANAVQIPADAKRLDLAGRTVLPGSSTSMRTARRAWTTSCRSRTGRRSRISRLGVTTVHDPSNQATRNLRRRRISARRHRACAAYLLDRRRCLWRALRRIREHRHARGRAKSHRAAQGARRDLDQELQPAASRAAPDGRHCGARSRPDGRRGGRLAVPMDMAIIADGNTGLDTTCRRSASTTMCCSSGRNRRGLHADAGRHVRRSGQRALLLSGSDVWTHPILSRYVPPHVLQPRSVRRQMAPASDYQAFRDSAANGKRLMELGVLVNIGAHGQREGLGSHWEMWGFVEGGMSPMQALQAATHQSGALHGTRRRIWVRSKPASSPTC